MAKKIEHIDSDFDLDASLDFDDFDFPDPFAPDDRKPVIKAAHGFAKGVGTTLRDTKFLQDSIRNVLPSGYGQTIDLSDKLTGNIRSVYEDGIKEIKPVVNEFKRVAAKLIPKDNKFVPKAVQETLARWHEERQAGASGTSSEPSRESLMSSQMTEIFEMQAKQEQTDRGEDIGRANLQSGLELARHKDLFSVANSSAVSLSRMEQYQSNVQLRYQKKALELQYRQLFATQDFMAMVKQGAVRQDQYLTNIVKNTGLPEYVKITQGENLKQVARNKFMNSVTSGLFGGRNKLVEETITGLRNSVMGQIKGLASGAMSGLGGAEMASETAGDMPGVDRYALGGNAVGTIGAQWAGGKLGNKLRGKLKDSWLNKKFGIMEKGDQLSNFHENINQKLTDFRREDKWAYDDNYKSVLMRMLQGIIPNTGNETQLESFGAKDMTQPYAYTRQTDRSINQIIPGYLSMLLREQQITRTGDASISLTEFDHDKGAFSTQSALRAKIMQQIAPAQNVKRTQERLDELVKMIQADDSPLSENAKKALKEKLLLSSAKGGEGNEKKLARYEAYSGLDEDTSEELVPAMKKFFASLSAEQRREFTSKYNRLTQDIGDSRSTLQNQAYLGQNEALQEMGFVDPTGKTINIENIVRRYLADTPGAGVGPSGPGQLGPLPGLGPIDGQPPKLPGLPPRLPGLPQGLPQPALGNNPGPDLIPLGGGAGANDAAQLLLNAIENSTIGDSIKQTNAFLEEIEKLLKMKAAIDAGQLDAQAIGANAGTGFQFKKLNLDSIKYSQFKTMLMRLDRKREELQRKAMRASAKGFANPPPETLALGMNPELRKQNALVPAVAGGRDDLGDLYVLGEKSPRVQSVMLRMGRYHTRAPGAAHGKVVTRPNQITSDLFDERGNLIVSTSEVQSLRALSAKHHSLIAIDGAKPAVSGAVMSRDVGQLKALVNEKAKISLAKIDKAYGSAFAPPADVFVQGSLVPRLYAAKLKAGDYVSEKTGKRITRQHEIDGVVKDTQGNVVISLDELPKLQQLENGLRKPLSQAQGLAGLAMAKSKEMLANMFSHPTGEKLNAQMLRMKDKLTSSDAEVRDVFVQGSPTPRVYAVKLKEGAYRLAETGKQIYHQSEITGELKDENGTTVVTGDELPKLMTYDPQTNGFSVLRLIGSGIKGIGSMLWHYQTKIAPKWVAFNFRMIKAGLQWGFGAVKRMAGFGRSKVKDVYVGKEKEPRLYAAKLKAGQYHHKGSGMAIMHQDDIRGEVVDADGEVVLSVDDLDNLRVYDSALSVFNPLKLIGISVNAIRKGLWAYQTKVAPRLSAAAFRLIGRVGKGVVNIAKKFTKPKNVYVNGRAKPVLLATTMGEGRYFSSVTKTPITRANEIDGPVVDENGEVVLSEEDIQAGLTDFGGQPITTGFFKSVGKVMGKLGKMLSIRRKFSTKRFSGGEQNENGKLKTGVSLTKPVKGAPPPVEVSQQKTVVLLQEIKDIFKDKFGTKKLLGDSDGDGTRDGSYKDKMAKKLKAKSDAAAAGGKGAGGAVVTKAEKAAEASSSSLMGLIDGAKTLFAGLTGFLAMGSGFLAKGKGFLAKGLPLLGKGLKLGAAAAGSYAAMGGFAADAVAGKMGVGGNEENKRQDDANWDKANVFEKMESGLSRGIEKAGSFMFLDNFANEARSKRVKSETAYMAKKYGTEPVSPDGEQPPKAGGGAPAVATKGGGGTQPAMAGGALADGRNALSHISLNKGVSLEGLNPALLKNFYGMSEEYGTLTGKKVLVKDGFRTYAQQVAAKAKYGNGAASPGTSMHEFGLAMDVAPETLDEMDKMGLMRKYGLTRPVGGEPWHLEPAGVQPNISGFKTDTGAAANAIDSGVGRGGGGFGSIPGTPKPSRNQQLALNLLNANISPNVVNKDPSTKPPAGPILAATSTPSGAQSTPGSGSAFASKPTGSMGVSSGKNPNLVLAGMDGEKPAQTSMGAAGISNNSNTATAPLPADPTVKIPDPTGSGYEGMRGVISAAAKMVGVDEGLLMKTAAVESGFNPNAKAGTSSASGLFQFTKDTWAAMVSKYGAKYGYVNGVTSPFDVKANAVLGAHYIKETVGSLKKNVRRAIGATEAYIGHFMGPGGGARFLNALENTPDTLGATFMPASAKANQSIFYDGARARTLSEIYAVLDSKVRNKLKSFGIASEPSVASTAPAATTTASNASQYGAPPSLPGQVAPVKQPTPSSSSASESWSKTAASSGSSAMTAPVTNMGGSPLADAYGFRPNREASAERSKVQPSPMGKELFATTEGLLSQSVDLEKKMVELLESIYGIVAKIPESIGSANAPAPKAPSSRQEAQPYAIPQVAVPMRRTLT